MLMSQAHSLNDMIVVDGDPNNDGNPSDAMIVGRVDLIASPKTQIDDTITGLAGTGGQGGTCNS